MALTASAENVAGVCMWERECGSIKLRLRFIKLEDLEKSDWFFAGAGERSLRHSLSLCFDSFVLIISASNSNKFRTVFCALKQQCLPSTVACAFGGIFCNGRIMKIVSYLKVLGEYGTA